MDGLSFVNGMEMSPDGEFLLLCETGRARIHKYYLKGNTVITKLSLGMHDKKLPYDVCNIEVEDFKCFSSCKALTGQD
jgi:sugar lactone lactonase YvrE